MYKLSLIIPCYNEESTLEGCVEKCLELQKHNIELELVIVNDCSSDKSETIAKELQKKYSNIIKFVSHEVNQGKGAALQTGFLHATGDYIGIQDADMEYNCLDYLNLLDTISANKADVVYGSRYLKNPSSRRVLYFWHTCMNKFLTLLSNMFTNLDITDMEVCYKLFRRDVIQEIAPKLKEKRFGFEPEITARVAEGGYSIYECEIDYNPRSYEEGKKIGWKDGMRAMYCVFHYSAHIAPLPMQLIIYFFIGFLSAIINIISFAILYGCTSLLSFAVVSSFVIAALVNYFLCIAILFKHLARWSKKNELIAYILVLFVMGVFDYYSTRCFIGIGMSIYWSKFWAISLGFIGNFVLRKKVVF